MNWLEGHLRDYPGAILIVTHDRYFLDNVTGWILELDRGRGIPHEGNYTSYLKQKARRLSASRRARTPRARSRSRWRRSGWAPAPRRARPSPRPASSATRISSTSRANRVPSATADRHPRRRAARHQRRRGSPACRSPSGDKQLIDQTSPSSCRRAASVGVIGPNGAGKTTLFRMITGQEKPDDGVIQVGESVKLGYVDQSRDKLDGKKNVWEEISDGQDIIYLGKREINLARLHRRLQLQGRRPAEEGRPALRRPSATASTSPRC